MVEVVGPAEDRPDELKDAFAEARERGLSWREAVDRGAPEGCLKTREPRLMMPLENRSENDQGPQRCAVFRGNARFHGEKVRTQVLSLQRLEGSVMLFVLRVDRRTATSVVQLRLPPIQDRLCKFHREAVHLARAGTEAIKSK